MQSKRSVFGFTKIIGWVIAALLVLSNTFCASAQQTIDKIVAKVDNYIVLKSDVDMAYYKLLEANERFGGGDLRCVALQQLVVSKLMLAKAEIDSVNVEPKMVDDQLDRKMGEMLGRVGGPKKMEELYGKTVEQMKAELRPLLKDQLIVKQMQDNITKDIKVTPGDVKKFYNAIPKDSLPFFSKEVEVGVIALTGKVGRARKLEAKAKLAAIKERIIKGEKFSDLAKEYSQDPGSGIDGGNLGYAKKGQMVPEFEGAALALQPGQLSDLVESQFGFHLIELLDRKGNEYSSRHILIKPSSSETDLADTKIRLDSIRQAITLDSISFGAAARKYSNDEYTKPNGGLMTEEASGSTRIPLEGLDPVIYFVIDTMKIGQISKPLPIRMPDGKDGMRIIYYKSVTPPHEANLKDDYQRIHDATLAEKKNRALNDWFEKSRGEVFITVDKEYKKCELFVKTAL